MLTQQTWLLNGLRMTAFGFLLYVSGCATQHRAIPESQIRPDIMTPAFETRDVLLKWYDESFKTYYDVRGPVRQISLKPIMILAPVSQAGTEIESEFLLQFDRQGKLLLNEERRGNQKILTRYSYHTDGRSDKIEMIKDDALMRVVNFHYSDNMLDNTVIHDKVTNHVTHIRQQRVARHGEHGSGWIDISMPVETIDVIHGNEFMADGALIWSSKGGLNNGIGYYYLIKTSDEVISSSIKWRGDKDVIVSGGYQYEHDDDGRLTTVISLGANDGGVYHTTYYRYGEFGLLQSEHKQVSGKSLFNRAADEEVEYIYHELDRYGNWLARTIVHTTRFRQNRYHQHRQIEYY